MAKVLRWAASKLNPGKKLSEGARQMAKVRRRAAGSIPKSCKGADQKAVGKGADQKAAKGAGTRLEAG